MKNKKVEDNLFEEDGWDWEEEKEILWCVKRNLFPCFISISKKNLTLEEAKRLSKKWNNETDCYETYTYEKQ